MMMYGQRAASLRRDVLNYIKGELSRKEFIIQDRLMDEDEQDYPEGLFHEYLDDGHYTNYRLHRAYKEDDKYYVEGFVDLEDDKFDFELEYLPLDLLCDIADIIFAEPLKYLPDDFRGSN